VISYYAEDGRVIDQNQRLAAAKWTHGIGLYALFQILANHQQPRHSKIIPRLLINALVKATPNQKHQHRCALFLPWRACMNVTPKNLGIPLSEEWAEWVSCTRWPRVQEGGFAAHLLQQRETTTKMWDDTLNDECFASR